MCQEETNKLIKQMRKARKDATKSPDLALAYLKKLGILTEKGNLTKQYKGLCIPINRD